MTPDEDHDRDLLVAQIDALKAVVKRQRRTIDAMRASRFWKLRDAYFALRRRFGGGIEPLAAPTAAELATEAAASGDPYQLFRLRAQRGVADTDWLRALTGALNIREPIDVIVDARSSSAMDLQATVSSLDEQLYPFHRVHVLATAEDPVPVDVALAVFGLEAGDRLEPDALLSIAVELHHGADVVYSDEDRLDAAGIPGNPSFKPDWSPETLLTRDYVGRLCAFRAGTLAASGGLELAHGGAMWYDALLRVTEKTNRVRHVARVLVHRRHGGGAMAPGDAEAAVRRALARRGEDAEVHSTPAGTDVRFATPSNDRVAVVIPTRDRADLLERCLHSLFERTTYPSFEVVVVDNASRERPTRALFERWRARAPQRFRVIEDASPFNYSHLNNRAVAETDAPYVLMLNNDTEVISSEWMSVMLAQARRPEIGAVGALLLYQDGTVQHAGVVLGGAASLAWHAYRFADPDVEPLRERLLFDTNCLAVTGACLLVARRKFLEVGGLDESLAVSHNDVDFCLKLYAAGYRNVLVPRARLFHYESKSRGRDDTRRKTELAVSEREAIRMRWPELARRDPYYNPNLAFEIDPLSVET